ncbi:MAG: hypothetical protein LBK61_06440, partial [Spirochaetaceae bacterium]|nr:hypothetical protein [Spirochaetaceae bacterium]
MDVSMKTGLSQNRACFDWKERNREWTVSVFRVIFLIALAFVYAACGKPPSGSGASLTIHYYRYAGDYENWNLWVWPAGGEGTGYVFDEPDDEGFVSSRITKAEAGKEYGMIVRRSEPGNDWAEKDVADDRFTGADEVWLVEGDPAVYTEKPDSPQPSFTFAVADSADTVTVTLPLPTEDFSVFAVYENGEKQAGSAVKGKTSRKVVITLEKPITDPAKQYTVRDASGFYKDKNVTMRNILDDFYYAGDDLGLTYRPEESVFKVWSPVAASVSVALFDNSYDNNNNNDSANDDTSNRNNARMYKMERDISSGVWTGHIREDLRGRYYLYYVAFSDGTTRWAADPYARAVSANGTRMAVVNLEETNPPGWNAVKKPPFSEPQDAVIYELHVRDFSMDENSGIRQQGKFLAFTETGTKSRENNATGLDYLTSLGVTHVHLLPVFDFASINELTVDDPSSQNPKFNWGYDPQNYNVPEGSYSTDPGNPPVRIAEFKRMVQSLQTAGI